MTIKKIKQYDLLTNDEGEFLLEFDLQTGQPESPQFYFDGQTLVLTRRSDQIIHFPDIPDEMKKGIMDKAEILLAECDDTLEPPDCGLVLDYIATMRP